MGVFSKDVETMDDLFVHMLRDIYYAEKQIIGALPKMVEKATNAELKAGLQAHLDQSRIHVTRLERVFEMHGSEPQTVDCPAIDGILKEASEVTSDIAEKPVVDAAIIASAQAVEHYEITRYGTLIAWASELGRSDCASVLAQTLDEEKMADRSLTDLAERRVNREAA